MIRFPQVSHLSYTWLDMKVVLACAMAAGLAACSSKEPHAPVVPTGTPAAPPSAPVLRRLTIEQYKNAVADLFGPTILVTRPLEPDLATNGLVALGSAQTSISPWGVEQYEATAYDVAEQAMGAPPVRAALGVDAHDGSVDLAATRAFAQKLARRAWRRPATEAELTALTRTGTTAAGVLGDFHDGLELVIAAVMQSPSFLFRAELGGPDKKLTAFELAERLSFFLWNSIPDDTLLAAAERGALDTDEGLRAEAARLLASPRAKAGVRAFFTDLLSLKSLDNLTKDPTIFPHYSTELGPAAREETLRDLEALVLDENGDYRDLFVREKTVVDRRLAAIYRVRAPLVEGFGEVTFTPADGRRGLLGHVSMLALNSHPVSSSATLRGRFVRETLLCETIPPPPVDVNTALPEPTGTARTLRDRVAEHLTNPTCNGCHKYMDPIGLGLESFDGIGRFRTHDHEALIDPSSALDSTAFANAWELGGVLRDHPGVPRCFIRNLFRYATGALDPLKEGDVDPLGELTARFAAHGYRVKPMLIDLIASDAFRKVEAAL